MASAQTSGEYCFHVCSSASDSAGISKELFPWAAIFSCSSGSGSNSRRAVHSAEVRKGFPAVRSGSAPMAVPAVPERDRAAAVVPAGAGGRTAAVGIPAVRCHCGQPMPTTGMPSSCSSCGRSMVICRFSASSSRLTQSRVRGQVSSTCMTSSSPRSRQVASQTTTAASALQSRENPVPRSPRHCGHGASMCRGDLPAGAIPRSR